MLCHLIAGLFRGSLQGHCLFVLHSRAAESMFGTVSRLHYHFRNETVFDCSPCRDGRIFDWDGEHASVLCNNEPARLHPYTMLNSPASLQRNTEVLDFEAAPCSPSCFVSNASSQQPGLQGSGQRSSQSGFDDPRDRNHSKRGRSSGAVLTTLPTSVQSMWSVGQGVQRSRFATNEGLQFLTDTTVNAGTSTFFAAQGGKPAGPIASPLATAPSARSAAGSASSTPYDCSTGVPDYVLGAVNAGGQLGAWTAEEESLWSQSPELNSQSGQLVQHGVGDNLYTRGCVGLRVRTHRGLQEGVETKQAQQSSAHSQRTVNAPSSSTTEHTPVSGETFSNALMRSEDAHFLGEECDIFYWDEPVGQGTAGSQYQHDWHSGDIVHMRHRAASDSLSVPVALATTNGKSRSMDYSNGLCKARVAGRGSQGHGLHPPGLPQCWKPPIGPDVVHGPETGAIEPNRDLRHWNRIPRDTLRTHDSAHQSARGSFKAGIGRHTLSSLQQDHRTVAINRSE